jgi:putative ABC transport system ATP-binding protein
LGPSGSGKSTLLYCLSGILTPDSGLIQFRDNPVNAAPDRERTRLRRESFGFVLQFGRLIADLTVAENVSLPLRLLGTRRREAERAAEEALGHVGLAAKAQCRTGTLSGGEQQRAAVVRALIHKPLVVFADEPTGSLDSSNGALIMQTLFDAACAGGSAVIVVTHNESLAAQCDRRMYLLDGRVNFTESRSIDATSLDRL